MKAVWLLAALTVVGSVCDNGRWDSHDFVVNQRARGKPMYTWDFTVTNGGRISSTRDCGDIYSVP